MFKPSENIEQVKLAINNIDPIGYKESRNYINGSVTYLSPYISRGIISTKQVLQAVANKGYKLYQIEQFVKELCWRDYFQRVGQHKNLDHSILQEQANVEHQAMPIAVLEATTNIVSIDNAINNLYQTGYMHNHERMYVASLVCNIAQSHWYLPSKWLYYNLLDGDWASNACSWQWVAGANSNKKYYANQENISKFTNTKLQNSFLNTSYEELAVMAIPQELQAINKCNLNTTMPQTQVLNINNSLPTLIFNYYNLDANWRAGIQANKILLLDPEFFKEYPVSDKCMNFLLHWAKQIPNMQIFVGSFESLKDTYNNSNFIFKEHPLNKGYIGTEEPRDWICPNVTDYYTSFFKYWNKISGYIQKEYFNDTK